ncbi:MAG: hypothetical protein PHR35_12445 [Kiritimatiellae bacterium]|nr:hypothetical protein [Kiritimatiellia bacterium]
MLFTDAQFIVWNQPSRDEIETNVAAMRKARETLSRHGLSLGINSSYNMRVSHADQRPHCDYDHWATYADGTTDYRGPCLLDPKLESYLDGFFRLLATVEPEYIYVDDDHRYMIQGERETWGCLCDLHVARFSERTDRSWERAALNAALLDDQGVRREWIAFLGERLVHLAGVIEQAVHAVSPGTKVGMMAPTTHCLPPVGHNLKNVLSALHPGPGKPLVRPCVGGYQDWRRRDLFAGLWYREYAAHVLGPEVEYTSEIETAPGTRLAKSVTVTRFQIAHGCLQRINAAAVSPVGYAGDSPLLEPEYPRMLRENQPYFEALRRHAPRRGTGQGIQLFWDFASAGERTGPLLSLTDLWWPAFNVAGIFGHLGIPATFDDAPIKAFFGDSIRCLPPECLREILGGTVLLDAGAARALEEMGFADMTGCRVGAAAPATVGAEKLTDAEFSGPYLDSFIPRAHNRPDSARTLSPGPGTREISALVDHDLRRIAPGVVLFGNRLGGRVAVLPYALHALEADLSHFICYHRRHQFKAIFDWMKPDALSVWLVSPSDVGMHLWQERERTVVCLSNLSFDGADEVVLDVHDPALDASRTTLIADDGRLVPMAGKIAEQSEAGGRRRWRLALELRPFRPAVLLLDRAQPD